MGRDNLRPSRPSALASAAADAAASVARQEIASYRSELADFRREFAASDRVPNIPFYLFGMGRRAKYVYRSGELLTAPGGKLVCRWPVKKELIVPPGYRVLLELEGGQTVEIQEDEEGVWVHEKGRRVALAGATRPVNLPDFARHRYPRCSASCIRNCW